MPNKESKSKLSSFYNLPIETKNYNFIVSNRGNHNKSIHKMKSIEIKGYTYKLDVNNLFDFEKEALTDEFLDMLVGFVYMKYIGSNNDLRFFIPYKEKSPLAIFDLIYLQNKIYIIEFNGVVL